jgi:hypothetical protein
VVGVIRIKRASGKENNEALFMRDARMAREIKKKIRTEIGWPGKRPFTSDKNFRMLANCLANMAKLTQYKHPNER